MGNRKDEEYTHWWYTAVQKVSQEDVLGILMEMDQYLFGKCKLMYFLILDNVVYIIESLLISAIWLYQLQLQ